MKRAFVLILAAMLLINLSGCAHGGYWGHGGEGGSRGGDHDHRGGGDHDRRGGDGGHDHRH